MKKLFTLLALAITLIVAAQAPQGFNYQATVRNSSGALIVNQNVLFKFNIMLNSQTSLPVYSETHQAPTDDLGQVNLVIGTGTPTTGTFTTINWGNGTYYLGIELNTGTGYVAMGTTQLLSVPYALYANTAGNSQAATPNLADVLAVNNGANNLQIKNLADPTDPQDAVTKSFSELQLQAQVTQLQVQIEALQNYNMLQSGLNIGQQGWATINLNVTTYRDGTPIPQVTDQTQWVNLTTGAWCYYNNTTANGTTYGKLYNWYAVAGIHDNDPSTPNKILAPQGWHIPSDAEWQVLLNYLDPITGNSIPNIAGGKMKSTGTSLWESPNTDATNESGFTGLPGGYRNSIGTFVQIGTGGYWWSSLELLTTSARGYVLFNYDGTGYRANGNKTLGKSVRCIKD
jgi:uncharacterized protein (TIGR02145 family)